MFKSIVAATAVFASALFAHAASYISGVDPAAGSMGNEGNAYTVSELKSASDMSDYNLGTDRGWVAGIKLTWQNNKQNATQTTEEFGDSAGWRSQSSFKVYNNGDKTPSGSGLINTTTSSGNILKTYYNSTAQWYVYVTPEMMYQWSKNGVETYTATLTVKETNRDGWSNVTTPTVYTITIPTNLMLTDSEGVAWYPAVGLLGDKVYGDAQYLANQIDVTNYDTVKFLVEPVGVTFGDSFAASDNGDGTWGVTMTHSHTWTYSVDGATLTATCGNAGCPVGGSTTVSLTLSGSDKVYDNKAITASADFDEYFEDIFPGATTTISIIKDEASVETIKDAGTYTVTMTVTGLGDGQPHYLTKKVVVNPFNIADATVTFNPSSITYDGKEHSVTCAVSNNATFEIDEASVTNATAIGEYTVVLKATGNNFTGTKVAKWEIKNTTGSLSGVTSAVDGIGSIVNENSTNTLTIANSKALEYSDGSWFAGITLEWPVETKGYSGIGQYGYAHYITEASAKYAADEGVFSNESGHGSYQYNLISSNDFDYLASTTWKVAITPAVVESALSEEKTALEWTMRAGAIKSDTYANGVAFADYTITLSLDKPVVFVLGEGEVYDLGDTELTTTKIQLAAGASVTSSVEQTVADALYTDVTGYDIVRSEEDGKYVYTAQLTHQHEWNVSKAENGYELVATCANDKCDINAGVVKMWLDVGTTEKVYDSNSVTRFAVYGDGFKTVYPDSTNVVLTVNGVKDGVINNAGEYDVVLTVNGVGEETYTLSRKVTISKVDITGATLVLTPATRTYNGKAQTVSPSVTVGGVTATLNDGLVVAEGSCSATEIGTYSVTVNGTGNFTGAAASATWSIVNTTGEPTSVTESAAGSMTKNGNDFTLSDSSKLEYDSENKAWYAGITISWPVETKDWQALSQNSHAYYVTEDCVRITKDVGEVVHTPGKGSYITGYNWLQPINSEFDYLARTTWTVELTPAIIEAAFAEEKTVLEYTLRAGAIPSDTYAQGVAFRDYTITIPLEGIKLYDGDGKQVYPKPEGQTIIEDIKDDIDTAVTAEVAESAKAKIDLLADVAGEGKEESIVDWVNSMKGDDAATFYAELAKSEYVEASFGLGTTSLISDASDVEVAEFESTDGGFTLAVTIDEKNIDAERIQQLANIIWSATSLGGESEFAPLVPGRISVEGGKVIVSKDANADCEFFKIMISKDSAE